MPGSSSNPDRPNVYLESFEQQQVLQQISNEVARRRPDSVDHALEAFVDVMKGFQPSDEFGDELCRRLVEAALVKSEIDLPSVSSLRKKMVAGIAEALMSDETSRSRLEAFWRKQKGVSQ